MKKFLGIVFAFAMLSVFTSNSFAQTNVVATPMVGNGVVLTGTATVACSLKVGGSYNTVSIQAVFTKTSGTLVGTATLLGSIDGVTYETVNTALVAGTASTYTVTDVASQGKTFVVTGSPYLYYKLSWTGAGTMVGTVSGFVLPRNYSK